MNNMMEAIPYPSNYNLMDVDTVCIDCDDEIKKYESCSEEGQKLCRNMLVDALNHGKCLQMNLDEIDVFSQESFLALVQDHFRHSSAPYVLACQETEDGSYSFFDGEGMKTHVAESSVCPATRKQIKAVHYFEMKKLFAPFTYLETNTLPTPIHYPQLTASTALFSVFLAAVASGQCSATAPSA